MINKININFNKQILIVYVVLTIVTLAVFGQVTQFDFMNIDDAVYVTENSHIQSGITPEGFRWAFSTRYADLWNPLVWLSFMFDYQLHGLKPGGYHLTNLILHILSTLLLFRLFCRMTGAIWKSAFVAALFALHPFHVESVAWIGERKDVLSAFFWMLTLCLYVYYTEKPVIRRYLLVVFSFVCALMSKPMVVTLPVIMILLDYWPLNRFESQKNNPILWQLKEKLPFFILSAVLVIITLHSPDNTAAYAKAIPLGSRIANAPVAFITYLGKTIWPYDLAFFYPFLEQLPVWQVMGSTFLILAISAVVIVMVKRQPYLFVGWLWFAITIAPVIGILQISSSAPYLMADRYHYLPSIGIAVGLAWGIPYLIKSGKTGRRILFPSAIVMLIIMAALTWQQCGYWRNGIILSKHALEVTKDNFMAHGNLGSIMFIEGRTKEALDNLNRAIRLRPDIMILYDNRGNAYAELGQYKNAFEDFSKAIQLAPDYDGSYKCRGFFYSKIGRYDLAVEDFNKAIQLRPDYADAYNYRGTAYSELGKYEPAVEDFNKAIQLKPDYADAYNRRGSVYLKAGQYRQAVEDFNAVIRLSPDDIRAYNNRGILYSNLGQYEMAIRDFSKAIILKGDYANGYNNRAFVYFKSNDKVSGCRDAKKACELKNCTTLEMVKKLGYCN